MKTLICVISAVFPVLAQDVDVIVQYRAHPSTANHMKIVRKGGTLRREFASIPAAHYTIPAAALSALAADPAVAHISANHRLSGAATANTPGYDYMPQTIGANQLPAKAGAGIGVAVIDSGITPNPDLNDPASGNSRIVYSQSFVTGDSDTTDHFGHGTHVAGLIASNGQSSAGTRFFHQVYGVATGANLINLRVLDQNGVSTDAQVIAAIDQAIALKATYNIRVINLSVGRPVYESYALDPLCQAVEAAWNAGIVVVVAAGNDGRNNSAGTAGYATINAPGNDPLAITVGAMKTMQTVLATDDLMASYSSKGPTLIDHIVKPDLVAPGNRLYSVTDAQGTLNTANGGNTLPLATYAKAPYAVSTSNYFLLSGTSMSAAVVSGAAAALLGQNPALTPDTVKARLMKSASKAFPTSSQVTATDPVTNQPVTYTTQYDLFTVGAGYLNLPAALANTDTPQLSSASPAVQLNLLTGQVTLINGATAVWGSNAVWGDTAVWGSSVFLGGTTAVWGSNAVWGDTAVWGSNAVWGDTTKTTAESLDISVHGEN
jgi:serine protease AprX